LRKGIHVAGWAPKRKWGTSTSTRSR
jgi:hypothetical protein